MDDYPMYGMVALSILLGPLYNLFFPLGFRRVCSSHMMMRSGKTKQGLSAAEQAEVDRRLAEKQKEKELKKKQKEEEVKTIKEEREKLEKQMKEKERKLQEELNAVEEEEEEEIESEDGERLHRRQTERGESSKTGGISIQMEAMNWLDQFGYRTPMYVESEEDKNAFVMLLAATEDPD